MNFFSEKAQIYLHCIMFWRRVYKGSIVTLTSCKLEVSLVTDRNKVVAKVMFLHVSVIPPWDQAHPPPSRTKETPPPGKNTAAYGQ